MESIHIDQRQCKNHHPWVLLLTIFRPYELTLNAANISLAIFFRTYYRSVQLSDEYTWFMLSGKIHESHHKPYLDLVALHLTCLTTDVYVEHMIRDKTSTLTSALYKWTNTSQSVWLNVPNVNIILISDRNKIVDTCRNVTRGIEVIEFIDYEPVNPTIYGEKDIDREKTIRGFGLR